MLTPPPISVYGGHGRRRLAAMAAIAAVLIAVAVTAAATVLSPSHSPKSAVKTHRLFAQHAVTRHAASTAAADQHAAAKKPATSTTSAPQVPPAPTPAPTATSLEAQGHALMVGGQYHSAIPVLRQAVAAAPHSSLTYAYALFDLGRSLRLAGDPRAAVMVLYQRLQIPNQTPIVKDELALALEALGQSQASGGASPTGGPYASQPPARHGRRHGDLALPGGPAQDQGD